MSEHEDEIPAIYQAPPRPPAPAKPETDQERRRREHREWCDRNSLTPFWLYRGAK